MNSANNSSDDRSGPVASRVRRSLFAVAILAAVLSPAPAAFAQASGPGIAITKDDGSVSVDENSGFSYTLQFQNTGDVELTDVTITDTVPINTTFDSVIDSAGWSCTPDTSAGSICTLDVGSLAAGASDSVTFPLLVNDIWKPDPESHLCPPEPEDPQVQNTAEIVGQSNAGEVDDSDTDATPVNVFCEAFDLAIDKTGPFAIEQGDDLTYTLTYENRGNVDLNSVTITDIVPLHTTFNADGPDADLWECSGLEAGSACIHDVGAMTAGATGSVQFPVTVVTFPVVTGPDGCPEIDAPENGGIFNTAFISAGATKRGEVKSHNNSSSDATAVDIVSFECALDVELSVDPAVISVRSGDDAQITITVHNSGDVNLVNIAVSLPSAPDCFREFDSLEAGESVNYECTIPDIRSGFSDTLTVTAESLGGGNVTDAMVILVKLIVDVPVNRPPALVLVLLVVLVLGWRRLRYFPRL